MEWNNVSGIEPIIIVIFQSVQCKFFLFYKSVILKSRGVSVLNFMNKINSRNNVNGIESIMVMI